MDKLINFGNKEMIGMVNLDNGQLVSLASKGIEYFHDGGKSSFSGPGWQNSEIIPYPIFGPANNQKVNVNGWDFSLEQHGISRYIPKPPFAVSPQKGNNILTLIQHYNGQNIPNPKYNPGSNRPEHLNWLPYTLKKTFEITEEELNCKLTLTNDSCNIMPYAIGWHPAFRVQGRVGEGEFLDDQGDLVVTLDDVVQHSNLPPKVALIKEGINSISYRNKNNGQGIKISSRDFGDKVLLWSPSYNSGMLCIEHTTKLPTFNGEGYFNDSNQFESLVPKEKKTYSIVVRPLRGF